ncbi:hypothetical protein BO99DRAFT_408446 [Aspergillus violaceofuscus CBS 115571]|uniref:Uncharacterized protein n=1 Tax=Aspergillus violaceofuscus (strain CBS 115571) TaxID=1450538 RepID=A0A2V5HJ45_ASPV1|nr:hypothetical protein BO99DRAFT_408446 [Aspergillus violaceofuscus CBS 115571]
MTFLMLAGGLDHARAVRVLLEKGSNILAETDELRDTVLHFATRRNVSMATFQILLERGGFELIKRQNKDRKSALHFVIDYGGPEMVRSLVEKTEACSDNAASEVLGQCDDDGWTALHHAAYRGKLHFVEYLLEHRVNARQSVARILVDKNINSTTQGHPLINQKDDAGWTARHVAAIQRYPDIFNLLLERGADLYATTDNGTTALQLAASHNSLKNLETILNRLDVDFKLASKPPFHKGTHREALEKRRDFVSAKNTLYYTDLWLAADRYSLSSVLENLESKALFPELPAQDEPHFPDSGEIKHVSDLLLHFISLHEQDQPFIVTDTTDTPTMKFKLDNPKIIVNHMDAIIYWAVLNRQKAILDKYLAGSHCLPHLDREGMSWAAVAALGADITITDTILRIEYGQSGMGDSHATDLLSLGISSQNLSFIRALLHWLEAQSMADRHDDDKRDIRDVKSHGIPVLPPSQIVRILFDNKGDEQNLISLSACGGSSSHRDIESFLWKVLDQSVGKDREHFVNLAEEDQDRILELVARYKSPDNEAVSLKKPVVLWWLLSNGEYPTEDDIKHAEEQAKFWGEDDKNGQIILELFNDPPPIRQTRAPADDHHRPSFEHPASDFGSPRGTVLDFLCENGQDHCHVLFQLKHCPVIDIIYSKGPETIMYDCKYREVTTLRDALQNAPPANPLGDSCEIDDPEESKMAMEQELKQAQKGLSEPDVRWVHIPVTNYPSGPIALTDMIQELLVRLSKDKSLTNKDHRPLASFIDNNQVILDAGGHKAYMKPQYVVQVSPTVPFSRGLLGSLHGDIDFHGRDKGCLRSEPGRENHATLFCDICWSKWPRELDHNCPRQSLPEPVESQEDPTNQEQSYMTLDQYNYSSISDTTERDSDQVAGRFTRPKDRRGPDSTPYSGAPRCGSLRLMRVWNRYRHMMHNGCATLEEQKPGRVLNLFDQESPDLLDR